MQDVHIGPLPPNLNGISIYLSRLSKIDQESEFINWDKIMKFSKFFLWILNKSISSKKILNYVYHPPSLNQKIVLFLISLFTPHEYSLVIHGNPIFTQYNKSSSFTRVIIRLILNKANYIQVVNPIFKELLKSNLEIKNERIFIKNAFIPPSYEKKEDIFSSYSSKLLEFIEKSNPILLATASCIMFYEGEDLYGLDLSVKLTHLLKKDYPNIGFIFALANSNLKKSYLRDIKDLIKRLDIDNNFLLLTENNKIWPLFEHINLFIRPTNRDGDSISVREAIHFKCPVLASNVTSRPKGTFLFKNRNLKDLYHKSKRFLDKKF